MQVHWVTLVNFASALEAEMLVERLRAAGLTATSRGNDIVGIFGPGFAGPTTHGVDVMVASTDAQAAGEILEEFRDGEESA